MKDKAMTVIDALIFATAAALREMREYRRKANMGVMDDDRALRASLELSIAALEAEVTRLRAALEAAEVDVSLDRTWCRICRTEDRSRARDRGTHPHAASCPLAKAPGKEW